MTQLMIQGLHQVQIANGGANAKATDQTTAVASTALDTTDSLMAASTSASAATSPTDLSALTTSSNETTNPLLQLLKALQKDTEELLPAAVAMASPATVSATATSTAAAQPAVLSTVLQQAVTTLQQQIASLTLPKTALAAVAQANTAQTSNALINTKSTSVETNTSKAAATTTVQDQMFAATTAAVQEAPTASATPVSTVAAALVSSAESKSTDADSNTGSDLSSGGNHTASAGTAANLGSGFSADGVQATGTYSFASTLSALRATNGGTTGLPTVVDQVILQMNRNVKNGSDQMSLQLHPSDLGKITVKLDFGADGKVQGTVTADNPQTLSMLQKDSRSLERALQDAGLRADPGSLQFNLGGQGGNHAGQTANGQNSSGTANADGTLSASDSADGTALVDIGAIAETYYVTPAGVNIRV